MEASHQDCAQLLTEVQELLQTVPPRETRRHDTPANHAWLGKAGHVIETWNPQKGAAFSQLVAQFHSPLARTAGEAFGQIMVLLHQAESELRLRMTSGSAEAGATGPTLRQSTRMGIRLPIRGLCLRFTDGSCSIIFIISCAPSG